MIMGNERKQRRLSIRYEVRWPVTIMRYHLKLHCRPLPLQMTPAEGQIGFVSFLPQACKDINGSITGETINLSAGGAYIACRPVLAPYEVFRLAIDPSDREPLIAICQVVDSNICSNGSQARPAGMGIRFVHISREDRRFIYDKVPKSLQRL